MIKIGILTCIHSNDVCARVGCLNAFYDRKNFFADYPEDARLTALFTCNGCEEERPKPVLSLIVLFFPEFPYPH